MFCPKIDDECLKDECRAYGQYANVPIEHPSIIENLCPDKTFNFDDVTFPIIIRTKIDACSYFETSEDSILVHELEQSIKQYMELKFKEEGGVEYGRNPFESESE